MVNGLQGATRGKSFIRHTRKWWRAEVLLQKLFKEAMEECWFVLCRMWLQIKKDLGAHLEQAALRLRFKFKRKFWSHRLSLFYIVLDLQYFNNLSVKLKFKNFGFIFYYVECKQDLHLYFAAGRIQVLKIIHFICLLCCVIASSCYFISLYAVLLWPVFFWVL